MIIIKEEAQIGPLLCQVRKAANRTAQAIRQLMIDAEPDGIEVLRRRKFTEMAWHPLDDRPLNFVELLWIRKPRRFAGTAWRSEMDFEPEITV